MESTDTSDVETFNTMAFDSGLAQLKVVLISVTL